jgi:hypothetical protein
MILGQVVNDLNGNGQIDGGEPGQPGVIVYVDPNTNDTFDVEGTIVEPDDYADGEVIDASADGITFSVAAETNEPIDDAPPIVARNDTHTEGVEEVNHSSTGTHVFARDVNFFNHFFRLRIDFENPASHVQIDFAGSRPFAGDVGVLEAYTADGTLVGTYQTNPVLANEYETMHVASSTANIAYATAYTHREDGLIGRLDKLVVNGAGTEIWTTTDEDGNYGLAVPGTGIYRINEVVPENYEQTWPVGEGGQSIAITVGQTGTGIDFLNKRVAGSSWQNPVLALDVNNDGGIHPIDALLIINELNNPVYRDPVTGELPAPPAVIPAYFDVDADGYVVPTDAILVINYLNAPPAEEESGEGEPMTVNHLSSDLDPEHVESAFQGQSLHRLLAGAVQDDDAGSLRSKSRAASR